MSENITFVHGWGMNSDVWDKISTHFSEYSTNFIDIGFINSDNEKIALIDGQKSIYITHSLGAAWALKHHFPQIKALISINGFVNFRNFVDERTLLTMQKRLTRNPVMQMKSFWNSCGLPENKQNDLDGTLNTDKLHQGLEWLMNWDVREELNDLSAPILSLCGQKDLVLPYDQMITEWSNHTMKTQENGGHVLPLSHPEWCVQEIKEFIGELKLEG